ncbi:ABC transporter permease [Pusillimonas sp.]|uniref:ABC transporter permease n=1 Tax=Pusillimonas sp. TaxID=3040095 RepID=UPI0037C73576
MKRTTWFCITVAALFALWWGITTFVHGAHHVLPRPEAVWAEAKVLAMSGDLSAHIAASLRRAVQGFILALLTGIPLGLLLGLSKPLFRLFQPLIEVLRPISPIAWIPLSVLWFGIEEGSKLFIIWLIAFFFILLATISGVANVNRRWIEAAKTLGASRFFILRKVVLFGALPQILVGARLGLAVSIGGVLLAEMIAAESGIGFMMERARVVLQPEPVVIGMILLALIGYSVNRLLVLWENRLLRYRSSIGSPEK